MSDAIRQINYYVNEASPETLIDRTAYLTSVFIPWLRRGLDKTTRWANENPSDKEIQQLHSAYQAGVKFFDKWEQERKS